MKIAIIGNCQVISIKAAIDVSQVGIEASAYETWRMSAAEIEALGNNLSGFDAVLSQPLISGNFAGLAKDKLQDTCKALKIPLLFIHNLYFDAIVPDCLYVGKMGKRIRGPVSDYHSSIVLKSFLNGDNEATCLEKLRSGDMTDVPSRWRASVAELIKREEHVDVGFVDEMAEIIKAQDSMHFINHPKPDLVRAYTEKMLSMLLQKTVPLKTSEDTLAVFGSWPVYNWVSEKLGFDYQTDFFLKERFQGKMEFSEFISQSFKTYSDTPAEYLAYNKSGAL